MGFVDSGIFHPYSDDLAKKLLVIGPHDGILIHGHTGIKGVIDQGVGHCLHVAPIGTHLIIGMNLAIYGVGIDIKGEEFECVWDEREVCTREGYEADLYNIKLEKVCTSSDIYEYITVKDVEFLDERGNVYNGTVAVYHNYFTVDENTNTIVNQLNCGE